MYRAVMEAHLEKGSAIHTAFLESKHRNEQSIVAQTTQEVTKVLSQGNSHDIADYVIKNSTNLNDHELIAQFIMTAGLVNVCGCKKMKNALKLAKINMLEMLRQRGITTDILELKKIYDTEVPASVKESNLKNIQLGMSIAKGGRIPSRR